MKLLKLSFLFVIALSFGACGSDDDSDDQKTCTQSDWVGTYVGTETCDDGTTDDITISITASGTSALAIETDYPQGGGIDYGTITFNNCNLSETFTGGSLTASIDGDKITLKDVEGTGSTAVTCDVTATRTTIVAPTCTQADWLGTYTGTCGDRDVTLTITANGTDDIKFNVSSVGTGTTSNFGDLTYEGDGCTASYTSTDASDSNMTIVISGDEITITTTDGAFNVLDNCSNTTKVTRM